MSLLHEPTWKKAGIFQAVTASTINICKESDLVLGIAEKWCPDTKTFVFPWGEATITLEDVMLLLGFSVLGSPVFATLDSSGEKIKAKLEKEWLMLKNDKKANYRVTQAAWMRRFRDSGDELEHVAFLVLWLSYFVFPSRYHHMDEAVFSVALHLSSGTRIALAPAVLAHLYADLSLLKDHTRSKSIDKIVLNALFKLVQAWTYERFKELRPPKHTNPLLKGEPRFALSDDWKRHRAKSTARKILANSKMNSFEWRPYTKPVGNWKFPTFYPEKAMWVQVDQNLDEELISFARCIKASELVGMDTVEHYFPNRVASQFGLLQDVPCPVVNRNNISKKAAWKEYNKPIDGLTLYIPSRSAVSCFTSMFCEWWRKHKRAVELAESLAPRNIIRGDDDAFVPVPSSSKKRKSMTRVCKDDETHMDQVPTEKDEEDDNLTIAQIMRLRKKNKAMCSSDENPPKVLPLREVLQKLGKEFPEKLKRSRYLRTPTNVRSEIPELPLIEVVKKLGKEFPEKLKRSRYLTTPKHVRSEIADSGGSTSREVPLSELFQKEEVVKRKSKRLGDRRAGESCMDCYDNITTAEMVIEREKGVRDASELLGKRNNRLEADNKDSWIRQNIAYEDETGAQRKETGKKAGKDMVLSSASIGNNSSDPPLGANRGAVDIVVSRPETRQKCDGEVGVNGIKAEKKKTIVADGSKEAKRLLHEDGKSQRSNDKEDVDESLKQTNLAIDELALNLEARMMKVEKTLAKIREWKTIEKKQTKNGITA
ncbi:hypothetical protein Bca52824_033606 [Brassica carinata]|uniref:Aminotransferase-like plant mobile domain-containing protein n=1 Tax=Brassica carinata TaxID=52824 RepID=A0A8X7SE96_BRACI|nr:hypothetical protein Bca52824_033606 [Brassica carinata]